MKTKLEIYSLFVVAEQKHFDELSRLYGKTRARQLVYTKQAQGAPGSNLRLLHENKTLAREAWEAVAFRAA